MTREHQLWWSLDHDTVQFGTLISVSETPAASLIRTAVTTHLCTCGLQPEVAGFSKTLAHTYQTTRCHTLVTHRSSWGSGRGRWDQGVWGSTDVAMHFFYHWATTPAGQDLVIEDSWSHSARHTTVGRTPLDEWSSRRRDLYTQHSQEINTHAFGGIRTHNLSRRAAANPRLRTRSHWDRLALSYCVRNNAVRRRWHGDIVSWGVGSLLRGNGICM